MAKNIHVKWKSKTCSFESIYMRIRRDWGDVKPVTRVMRDRTKYNRKQKHKGRDWE